MLAGNETGGSANAKIMKIDKQGNIIWETVLPMMMENGARAWIDKCVQTPDGGYLAWVIESDYNSDHWAHALVRFDANGRKLCKCTKGGNDVCGYEEGGNTDCQTAYMIEKDIQLSNVVVTVQELRLLCSNKLPLHLMHMIHK